MFFYTGIRENGIVWKKASFRIRHADTQIQLDFRLPPTWRGPHCTAKKYSRLIHTTYTEHLGITQNTLGFSHYKYVTVHIILAPGFRGYSLVEISTCSNLGKTTKPADSKQDVSMQCDKLAVGFESIGGSYCYPFRLIFWTFLQK